VKRGWIKSWRKQYDGEHWLMKSSRPFCHMAAWQDLLCLADYKTGIVTDISQRFLAKRWGWDRSKVRRFIEKLKSESMINPTHQSTHESTHLTIVNYGKYQQVPTHQSTHQPTQSKEDKRNTSKEVYGELKNVKLKSAEYEKLVAKFGADKTSGLIANLSFYIASKGRKYKSHYATILAWERKNNEKGKSNGGRVTHVRECKKCRTGWKGMDLTAEGLCERCAR